MNATHPSVTVVRETLHDAKHQTTLSHAEQCRACSSTDDDQSDHVRFIDEYTWEDANGNTHLTKYYDTDERALELRKERRRFTRQREEERCLWQMEQMADEYVASQQPLPHDNEQLDEMGVSSTTRVTVSSYMTQRKAHLLRQSRQRHGEGPRSAKATQLEVFSAAQRRICADRRKGRSHKAASLSNEDGLTDLQSFERSGGALSRWAYCDWFSC